MRKICAVLLSGLALALTGCGGNEFDGVYTNTEGLEYQMEVKGDQVAVAYKMPSGRILRSFNDGHAEVKDKKLIIIGGKYRFIYGVAEDGETLECLSDSCQGIFGSGKNNMPRKWSPMSVEG